METTKQFGKVKTPPHFIAFLETLVAHFKPLQVYQYAQIAQQTKVNSSFSAMVVQEETIFYLLVITQGTTRIENGIQDFANQHYTDGKIVVQAHGVDALKQNML